MYTVVLVHVRVLCVGGMLGVCVECVGGRVLQCMLMCKRVALEASGNRHALHVPSHALIHTWTHAVRHGAVRGMVDVVRGMSKT